MVFMKAFTDTFQVYSRLYLFLGTSPFVPLFHLLSICTFFFLVPMRMHLRLGNGNCSGYMVGVGPKFYDGGILGIDRSTTISASILSSSTIQKGQPHQQEDGHGQEVERTL